VYPLSIYVLGINKNNKIIKGDSYLHVAIIITAFNEEKFIEKKIINTIATTYPKERIQIIVSSDGSTDKTNDIVEKYKNNGVELIKISERKGKENAQREALKHARGEVVVFTDVATILEKNAIERIVSNFVDPTIGCVSSEDRIIGKDGKQTGENLVRYEMAEDSNRVSSCRTQWFFFAARNPCAMIFQRYDSDLNPVK
jgi:cellulose synthase/poly-beta-1,6-N-acetylglucosamine synthase-like glycosyltransferase